MTSRLTGWLILGSSLSLLAGCGRGWGEVSGTVRYKGQALPQGTITFYDEANQVVSSPIAADGAYKAAKIAAGKVKITVSAPLPIQRVGEKKRVEKSLVKMPKLPVHYADAEQSGLKREVKTGSQTLDIDLD
jgi:hypothetical protein